MSTKKKYIRYKYLLSRVDSDLKTIIVGDEYDTETRQEALDILIERKEWKASSDAVSGPKNGW